MNTLAQITNPAIPPSLGTIGKAPAESVGQIVVGEYIGALMGLLFIIAFILTLFYMVLAGIEWLGSGGDKTHLENARNKMTHAIVGLVLVGASWAIMTIVGQFFGFKFGAKRFELPIPQVAPSVPQGIQLPAVPPELPGPPK